MKTKKVLKNAEIEALRVLVSHLRDVDCFQSSTNIKHDLNNLADQLYNLTLDKGVRTKEGWDKSKSDLNQYLEIGDEVDEDMYYYFLEVLPPACNSSTCVQIGEPYSHDADGNPTFATLVRKSGAWIYMGSIKTPDGEKCRYID